MNWFEVKHGGPKEYRVVLLQVEESGGSPPALVVGYMRKYSEGEFYVHPGADMKGRKVTHWCDCLGDDFHCPGWTNKEMNKR